MKRWHLLIIAGLLAILSSVAGYQLQQYLNKDNGTGNVQQPTAIKSPTAPKEVIGTKAEDFTLFDVDGKQRSLSEWQGKIIALNFWATWCGPCRDEIPAFVELQEQYSNDGLQFIGIALQQADEIRDFLEEFNVNYPSLVGMKDVSKLAKKLGNDIGALPYTVFIDQNGIISFTRRGPLLKSEAETVIQALIQPET
jgi:thiol-disulfide isomerase/thioredoxin